METSTRPARVLRRRRWLPWPKRIDISLLSFLALLIAYCDRVNMSVAAPVIMKEYGWDTAQMGWVLSGFFMGYTFFMIPAGMLVDRWGPKRMFAISVAWWSAFTALTPLPRSLFAMTSVRVFMGAGESGTFPSMNSILVRWFPREEYSRATAFCWSGGYAGPIIAFPLASAILHAWGWPAIFYLFAGLGLLWLPFWLMGTQDAPEDCDLVTTEELNHIQSSRPEVQKKAIAPWGKILKLPALWAVMILHFSSNWFSYVMISWLPTYLTEERHFSLSSMALGSSLPFLSALIGTNLFGNLIDRMSIRRDRTRVRKLFLLPYALAAAALLLLPVASTPPTTVLLLCLAMALMTGATPVYASSSMELAPRYTGSVVALQNSFANMAGILAPVVIGYVVKATTWQTAFVLTALVSTVGIVTFLLFGKAEKQID
jgi:ACS family glucarate transporter-like MFS transporter